MGFDHGSFIKYNFFGVSFFEVEFPFLGGDCE